MHPSRMQEKGVGSTVVVVVVLTITRIRTPEFGGREGKLMVGC